MSSLENTTTGTRGDRASAAAGSLRAILRQRRTYNLTRTSMLAIYVGLWALIAVALVHMAATRAPDGVMMLVTVAFVAIAGRFVASTQGASTLLISAAAATVAALSLTQSQSGPKLTILVSVLAILATLLPLRVRSRRLPTTPTALLCQWGMVLAVVASRWAGPAVIYAAGVVVLVVVAVQCNVSGWVAYRQARKRSGIPTMPVSHRREQFGLKLPPLMARENIERGIEAESATAETLATLGGEYVVLHSRAVPGSDADIDHLVIGPHGVAVVDSKYRTGDMQMRERTVTVPGDGNADKLADAAMQAARDHSSPDMPDEVLSKEALRAREHAYEASLVAVFVEDGETTGSFPEWYLNGAPASSGLMSSAAWETRNVEYALAVPDDGQSQLPCLISVYGARMSQEWGTVPLLNENGHFDRWVDVVHSRAIADRIRDLPVKITDPQMVSDLATIVDYLFPRK